MTVKDWLELLLVGLAAIPGIWAIVRQIKKERKEAETKKLGDKTQAETAEIFTNIASDLTSGMREEMKRLTNKVICLEAKQEVYEKAIRQLIKQIKALGVEPEISLLELDRMLKEVSIGG